MAPAEGWGRPTSRSRLLLRILALTLVLLPLPVALLTPTHRVPRPPPVTVDSALDGMWNAYGDRATCADWSGGDGTDSILLPDGKRAWFFSDTYLGSPAGRRTPVSVSSLHNSIVVQDGPRLVTVSGGNTCQERNTLLPFWDRYARTPATAPDAWAGGFYWTGDQMLDASGSTIVKFYYHGHLANGTFAVDYPALATIPVSSLERPGPHPALTITPQSFGCAIGTGIPDAIWGAALLSWHGYVYVYGWQASAQPRILYLARTTLANLATPAAWSLYDGLGRGGQPIWQPFTSCAKAPLPIVAGSGYSVVAVGGSLWLIERDGTGLAAGPIAAHPAATPWGFGNSSVVLYDPPEGHHDYPDYYLTYEPRVQPGFSGDHLVIAYNVNTTAVNSACVSANARDARIYRPRFIDVPLSLLVASKASAGPAGAANIARRIHDTQPAEPSRPATGPRRGATGAGNATGPPGSTRTRGPVGIDGTTDWYDQWGPALNGGCPVVGVSSAASVPGRPRHPD